MIWAYRSATTLLFHAKLQLANDLIVAFARMFFAFWKVTFLTEFVLIIVKQGIVLVLLLLLLFIVVTV